MNQILKKFLKLFYLRLLCFGIDARRIFTLRHYQKYRAQYLEFKKLGGIVTKKHAIFADYDDQAGSATGHYFHQDLLVASYVHRYNPRRHIDIGSRVDGFVAHVASFRKIDVMDVRQLNSTGHSNIAFIKADLMDSNNAQYNITDSISCLHAIEHFGLGRYGDPVDPKGHIKGFNNIVRMLKPDGLLFISFPIGSHNEVHFNAHRVFDPKDIFRWPENKDCLQLVRFDYVDDAGNLHQNVNLETTNLKVVFGCGIYTFKKIY
jgi:hypothetical protein